MKLATHYRVTGIHRDSLVDQWICSANGPDESDCRAGGDCRVINFLNGMDDFSAYALTPGNRPILTFSGNYDETTDVFQEAAEGEDRLELYAQNEYLEPRLNGEPVAQVEFQGESTVLLFPVTLHRETYLEHFGDEDEDDELGVLWDYAPGEEVIRASDPRFGKLLSLEWDYEGTPDEASRRAKSESLPQE